MLSQLMNLVPHFPAAIAAIPVWDQYVEFLERVLKVDAAKYNAIWVKKGFRDGLNPPPVKTSDAEVIATVKANPGAIGYVTVPPKDLKVLAKY